MMIDGKFFDVINIASVVVAVAAAAECGIGRVAAMDWRRHRPLLMFGYFLAAMVCVAAAMAPADSLHVMPLRMAALSIAAHLAATWPEWRYYPPESALREPQRYMVPLAIDSRMDDR